MSEAAAAQSFVQNVFAVGYKKFYSDSFKY